MVVGDQLSFHQFLNVRNAYHPKFDPKNNQLGFLTDITGVPQIWKIKNKQIWPDPITSHRERISFLEYSPVGEHLIYGMDSGGNEHQQLFLFSSGLTRALTDKPDAIHSFGGWSRDGKSFAFTSNRRHAVHFDIYVQSLDSDEAELLHEVEGSFNISGWSPDNKQLLVNEMRTPFDRELYLFDLASKNLTQITHADSDTRYYFATWSADGVGIYCLTDCDREFMAPAYIDLDSGELNLLDDVNWDAETLAQSPDGNLIAYTFNVDGYSELIIYDVNSGVKKKIEDLPKGILGGAADGSPLTFSPDGRKLAFSFTGANRNTNIWTYEIDPNEFAQITHSSMADIDARKLVEPELIKYPSFDGLEIPAYVYKPQQQPENLPVVVMVHGGPESQARPHFNPTVQYLVQRGYCVFVPNVRGSTGYGKSYTHLDNIEKRMDSVADLKSAVDWLNLSGMVDSNKIAVMGGSYGGFMVLAAMTKYPELWAVGINIVGIANFVTFLENTGPWRRHLRECEYGSLENDREFLESISPIHKVDQINAPLLVIHGKNDPRVPVGESEQIVESLRSRGQDVEYLCFDDEGHGLVKLKNKLVAYPAIADYLDKYLMK